MSDDSFKFGAKVSEHGGLLIESKDENVVQKVRLNRKEDVQAVKDAAEEALSRIEGKKAESFEDQDLDVNAFGTDAETASIRVSDTNHFVKINLQDTDKIDALATMLCETGNLDSPL